MLLFFRARAEGERACVPNADQRYGVRAPVHPDGDDPVELRLVAKWSWTEITRSVQGCRTGVIIYRTLVERPGFSRHAINTVTYTYERGRWLAISDQGTEVSPPTSG